VLCFVVVCVVAVRVWSVGCVGSLDWIEVCGAWVCGEMVYVDCGVLA